MPRTFPTTTPIAGLNGSTLGDFWSWAFSELDEERTRQAFARFAVAAALDATRVAPTAWTGGDFGYRERTVRVQFVGGPAVWDVNAPVAEGPGQDRLRDPEFVDWTVPGRADCWVLCRDAARSSSDPAEPSVENWDFLVLGHEQVRDRAGDGTTFASLARSVPPVRLEGLREAVDRSLA